MFLLWGWVLITIALPIGTELNPNNLTKQIKTMLLLTVWMISENVLLFFPFKLTITMMVIPNGGWLAPSVWWLPFWTLWFIKSYNAMLQQYQEQNPNRQHRHHLHLHQLNADYPRKPHHHNVVKQVQ